MIQVLWNELLALRAKLAAHEKIIHAYYERHKRVDDDLREQRLAFERQIADLDNRLGDLMNKQVFLLDNGNALIPVLGYDYDQYVEEVPVIKELVNVPVRSNDGDSSRPGA